MLVLGRSDFRGSLDDLLPRYKIVQQIAISMGCGILPHLKNMVEIIENGLEDEQQKVRTITALGTFSI